MGTIVVRSALYVALICVVFAASWSVTHIAFAHTGTPLFALLTAIIAACIPATVSSALYTIVTYDPIDLSVSKFVGGTLPFFAFAFVADSFAFRILGW
jgi:hypothetical protein